MTDAIDNECGEMTAMPTSAKKDDRVFPVVSRKLRRTSTLGFTLIELLTVIAVMFMIMGIGVGSFVGYTRGASMRGAISGVTGAARNARQYAITHQVDTHLVFDPAEAADKPSRLRITRPDPDPENPGQMVPVHTGIELPVGIQVPELTIRFSADGMADRTVLIELHETAGSVGRQMVRVLEVDQLTGWIEERP